MTKIELKLKTNEELIEEITKLITKNYLLENRIEKAIEHIENNSKFVLKEDVGHFAIFYREMEDITELLEILRGDIDDS